MCECVCVCVWCVCVGVCECVCVGVCECVCVWVCVSVCVCVTCVAHYFIIIYSLPLQAWSGPEDSMNVRFPDFMTTAQDGGKVVSLTHRPSLPQGNAPGTHFCWRLSRPQGHSAIGRIMSMKNSSDTIWDRTSNLPMRYT